MKKKHMGYALLLVGALRLYHEQVGFTNPSISSVMNSLDVGGSAVTFGLVGVGGYLVWKG